MANLTEQRYALKFMQKEGETGVKAYARLQAVYGLQRMSRTRAFAWFKTIWMDSMDYPGLMAYSLICWFNSVNRNLCLLFAMHFFCDARRWWTRGNWHSGDPVVWN